MRADLVVVSNNMFLGTGGEAAAVGVSDGRVAAVVPAAEADSLVGPGTEVRDYGDAFVCPGFHDAHQHVFHAALFPSALATQYAGTSERDCVDHMVGFAQTRPGTGWLVSHGWRDSLWDPPVPPSRASLDAVFPDRPVAMYSGDSHTLWVNTAGLAELGIADGSEPPAGGIFDRDADGRLTGVLREAAGMAYVARVLASFSEDELVGVYRDYFSKLSAMGVTSVCDMALSLVPGADGINPFVYEALLGRGELDVRSHLFPTLADDESNLESLQARYTGDMLRAPGFKQFFDGVSSQHTAWETEPYANPRFEGDCGRPTIEPGRMRELVLAAASRRHAVRIHAIGDHSVHEAIGYFAEARRRYGDPAQGRNSLEHVEDIREEDVPRLRAAHVVASVQPPHVTLDLAQPDRDLGPARAARMWPFASMERAGVTMAFGTDAPCAPPTSVDVLYCAFSRQTPDTHEPVGGWHPEQDVSRATALRAYTAGSAAAVGRERELGTIEPGRLADLVVWDHDLLAVPAGEFQASRPVATFVGGRCVYEA